MTLTELSYTTKRIAFWFVALVISFYVLKFIFLQAKSLYLTANPPKLPPAEASFGNVQKLSFDTLELAEGSFPTYVLDTKTGKLPKFPDRAFVYRLKMPTPRITAEKEAKEFAKSVNFWWKPTKKSLSEFTWSKEGSGRSLYFNIATKKIVLETEPKRLSADLSTGLVPSISDAQNKAQNFLKNRGLLTGGLATAEIKSSYVRASGDDLYEATNYLQANLIRVDFYRKEKSGNDTENLIYGNNPINALVSVYVAKPSDYEKRGDVGLIYPIFYYNNPTITDDKSSYPIIPIEKAWDFVKNGNGSIVYLKKSGENSYSPYSPLKIVKMEMRNVKLSYYQPKDPTPFLQPIYVFEGVFTTAKKENGTFYIYVQAIDPKHINL